MRVDWVHPSWRDLVIEELARDAPLRQRFLRHCGIDGAALALSTAGGAAGERVRPLLRCDADWDALGDGLHAICDELGQDDAVRLLAVLEGDEDEVRALAGMVLERLERRWHHEHVGVDALEAWTAACPGLPGTKIVASTWLELEPGAAPRSPVELERFADWLRLVELLSRHDGAMLGKFGFPDRFRAILDEFSDQRPEDEPPVERDLRNDARVRLLRIDPSRTIAILDPEPSLVLRQFELPEIDPLQSRFAIDRVLRDLVD